MSIPKSPLVPNMKECKVSEAEELATTLEEESQDNPDDYRWKAAAELRRLFSDLEECQAAYEVLKKAIGEPVAYLWQHEETGRTRITTPDSITDCDARWNLVGPLYALTKDKQ